MTDETDQETAEIHVMPGIENDTLMQHEPNEYLVQVLERLLDGARRGDVQAMIYAATYANRNSISGTFVKTSEQQSRLHGLVQEMMIRNVISDAQEDEAESLL